MATIYQDFNPVDYKIWGLMQERLYKTKFRHVEDLRKRILEAWDDFSRGQRHVGESMAERLSACVAAQDEHIEQLLQL